MSKNRTYQDHEVREILDMAIGQDEVPPPELAVSNGLTLGELQEVGRQVGLAPSRIAQAVVAYEGRGEAITGSSAFGLPTSVGRVVDLPRNVTDREWELLVAELRTTFQGKGEVSAHGSTREWSNGMLHVFVEPTETGYRLRMTEASGGAGAGMVFTGFFVLFGLFLFTVLLAKGDPGWRLVLPAFFTAGGVGIAGVTMLAVPRWARRQAKRMEQMCSYTAKLLSAPAATTTDSAPPG